MCIVWEILDRRVVMTEKKWTPGEWIGEDGGVVAVPAPDGGGDIVCEAPENWEESMVFWEHNAPLIAAAPELYEALEGLAFGGTERQYREMMNDAPCHNGITDIEGCSRCGRELKAIRALSKARGEGV